MAQTDLTTGVLDAVLVPVAVSLMIAYHVYLWHVFRRRPHTTVIGSNNSIRQLWVYQVLRARGKKDILAVQTMRNWIMGSSLLATLSVTLAFGIIAFFGNKSLNSSSITDTATLTSPVSISLLNYGGTEDYNLYVAKLFILVFLFLLSFFAFSQSIRLLNHCVFAINLVGSEFQSIWPHSSSSPPLLSSEATSGVATSAVSTSANQDRISDAIPQSVSTAISLDGIAVGEAPQVHGTASVHAHICEEIPLGNMASVSAAKAATSASGSAARDSPLSNAAHRIEMPYGEAELKQDAQFIGNLLNRAGLFYTIGTRGYYFSLPIIVWLFGPIPCIVAAALMVIAMPFLDFVRDHLLHFQKERSASKRGIISHGKDAVGAWQDSDTPSSMPPILQTSFMYSTGMM